MAHPPHGAAVLRAHKTEAIVQAVFAELAERGWSRLTVDAVAVRAGVGKPAIYRRWRSRDEMVLDCLVGVGVGVALPADTGILRDDLLAFTRQTVELLEHPVAGRVIAAVLSAVATDPVLAAQMSERFRTPRRTAARAAFQRAIDRGEIASDTDVELAIDLLAGPLYMHALGITGGVPAGYAENLTDAALRSLGSGRRAGSSRTSGR